MIRAQVHNYLPLLLLYCVMWYKYETTKSISSERSKLVILRQKKQNNTHPTSNNNINIFIFIG